MDNVQVHHVQAAIVTRTTRCVKNGAHPAHPAQQSTRKACLLYTSDAADERSSVDLGGRRIIKKKKTI